MRLIGLKENDCSVILSSNVSESKYDEWASGDTYSTGDRVYVTKESDGSTERCPHQIYESLADSNSGNYPPDYPDKWSLIGATNRWSMFNQRTNEQTSNTDYIEVELDSSDTDTIGLFRLVAKELTLTQIVENELITNGDGSSDDFIKETGWSYDSSNDEWDCDGSQSSKSKLYQTPTIKEGKLYQVKFDVLNYSAGNVAGYVGGTEGTYVSANGSYTQFVEAGSVNEIGVIADTDFSGSVDNISVKKVPKRETIDMGTQENAGWYYYLFSDLKFTEDYIWSFPRYRNSKIRVRIDYYSGEDAKCGICTVGAQNELGDTQYDPNIGIRDFSKKDTDAQGRTYLNQGPFAKDVEVELWLNNSQVDAVRKSLSDVRGVPAIYDCNNPSVSYSSLIIYGFFRDFGITIPGPTISKCNLDLEGLT